MSIENEIESEASFSCKGDCGGNCGCPNCPKVKKRKANMMALGYSEQAVDAIIFHERPLDYSEDKVPEMLQSRLSVIVGRARELQGLIAAAQATGMEVEIEQWAIDKLTLAADYVSAATDSMKYGNALKVSN